MMGMRFGLSAATAISATSTLQLKTRGSMTTKSPCRREPGKLSCTTGLGDEVCKLCCRTFEEVRDWNTYSDAQKIEINRRLKVSKIEAIISYLNFNGATDAAEAIKKISERLQHLEQDHRLSDDPLTALAGVMSKHGFSFGAQNVNPYTDVRYVVYLKGKRVFTKSMLKGSVIHDDIKLEGDKQ